MDRLASAPVHDGEEQVMIIRWRTRAWGGYLLLAAVAAMGVALVARTLDQEPWTPAAVIEDALGPALVGYLGVVLLRGRTELRLLAGGAVRIRAVPFPFLPPTRLAADEVATVEASRALGKRIGSGWRWRLELVTKSERRHPLCFGGIASAELAERTARAVREFLQLPP